MLIPLGSVPRIRRGNALPRCEAEIGKVNAGKPQLRIEEARQFTAAALDYFEETQHPLAIGALLALTLGLRTSEVIKRVVRDLDDGARYLWIDSGKTASARRHLEVPELR